MSPLNRLTYKEYIKRNCKDWHENSSPKNLSLSMRGIDLHYPVSVSDELVSELSRRILLAETLLVASEKRQDRLYWSKRGIKRDLCKV